MALSAIQIKMLRKLLTTSTEEKIAHALEKIHPSELSFLFSELNEVETEKLINSLFLISKAGPALREIPEFLLPDILETIEDVKLTAMLSRMESDDLLFFLHRVPESRRQTLIDGLSSSQRERIERLLLYPANSAGCAMSTHVITVRDDMTLQEAIEHLRKDQGIHGAFYIYVVDEANRLVGVQSLRQLVLAPPETKIRDVMDRTVRSVLATEDQEKVAQIVGQYNLLAIPIVNEQQELVGVITVDDVIDIVKEEATEDIYHLAGLSEEDRAFTPVDKKVKKRLPWMLINLGTAFLASLVVGLFEGTISKLALLAAYMPIVAGMGGNGGTQSLVVITRSIALGETMFASVYHILIKEFLAGLVMGLASGLIGGLVSYFLEGNMYLGLILFAAMTINLCIAGLMGALVPLTFKTLKMDPAVGSSVVLTTMTDCIGFFVFLGLATWLLPHLI